MREQKCVAVKSFWHICMICVCVNTGMLDVPYAAWSNLVCLLWCPCVHSIVFVCICMLKLLLHYLLSAFVMFCETWVLLCPGGTLIFHHAVCHITLYDMKVNVYILCCSPLYSSTSPVLKLPHYSWHPTHSPIAAHALLINTGSSLD